MDIFQFSAENYPDNICIIKADGRHTYRELAEQTEKYSELVSKKIPKGAIVTILSDYSFDAVAMFIALYRNKNIIVPVTTKNKMEAKLRIDESFSCFVIKLNETPEIEETANKGSHPLIESIREKGSSGLIFFSSGSTGKPKAMIHNLDKLAKHYEGKKGKKMTFMVFLMFDHIGGMNTLLNCISMGAAIVIPESRGVFEVCGLIEKHKVKVLPTSPTFLNLLLLNDAHKRHDLSCLRMITYGTEPMPESLLKKLRETFPRIRLLQTFGTSETGIATTSSLSSDSLYMKLEDSNVEHKIVNGELWLKSSTQILGYLNAEMESFTDDGWFMTGDLAEEKDGYIIIKGRYKEIINVGGEKVLPSEVESVLLNMQEIADCMVYGIQNAITGQIVAVDVVLSSDMGKSEAKRTIKRYCSERLEPYKVPVKINLVERTNFGDRFKKIRRKN